ncbi:Kinase-like protein [Mycena sanguinolenta]|uniref:Kinase-like protein n=1 Tax=Mycena sanguinolenta TaxID=230812 RepID=A0A8H6X8U3_9AGAR|nr:Kinase-like protein [Mycena sanguinolenta]
MNGLKAAARVVRNYAKGYSDTQVKVHDVTSSEPWGPSGLQMNEIAQLTYNQGDFVEILKIIDKQLSDKSALNDPRRVYKSLVLVDYLLRQGSENVITHFKDNLYVINTLRDFRAGKDDGANVREKAKDITSLLQDENRLRTERHAGSVRYRMTNDAVSDSGDAESLFQRRLDESPVNPPRYTESYVTLNGLHGIPYSAEDERRNARNVRQIVADDQDRDLRRAVELSQEQPEDVELRLNAGNISRIAADDEDRDLRRAVEQQLEDVELRLAIEAILAVEASLLTNDDRKTDGVPPRPLHITHYRCSMHDAFAAAGSANQVSSKSFKGGHLKRYATEGTREPTINDINEHEFTVDSHLLDRRHDEENSQDSTAQRRAIEPKDNPGLPEPTQGPPPNPSIGFLPRSPSPQPAFAPDVPFSFPEKCSPKDKTDPDTGIIPISDGSSSSEDNSLEDRMSKSGSSSGSRSVAPSTTPEPLVANTSAAATKTPLLLPQLQERIAEQAADAQAMSGGGAAEETERAGLGTERLAEEQQVQAEKARVAGEKAAQAQRAEEERIAAEEAERARLEDEHLAEEGRLSLEEARLAEERRVQVENERIAAEEAAATPLAKQTAEEEKHARLEADRIAEAQRVTAEEAERARLEARRAAEEFLAKQKATDNISSASESESDVSSEWSESWQTETYIDDLLASWERRRPLLSMTTLPDADRQGLSTAQVRQRLGVIEAQISTRLVKILNSRDARRAAEQLEGERAQSFVDAIQEALDRGALPDSSSRSKARKLMQKVSEAVEQLPSSLFIEGVNDHDEHPTFGGGFGDVYQASYQGKMVALKRIRTFTADSTTHRNRLQFYKEALVWQGLHHRFILPLLGIDRVTFTPSFCMVSPWMKHGTVLKYLRDHGRGDVNRLLLEIAQGLDYLHSMNVVHGDLRGNNILISDDGNACLSDFGLATSIVDADSTNGLTSTSNRAGSSQWFAPELIHPTKFGCTKFVRTKASDVYAYACVCLELYTGNPPFPHLREIAASLRVIDGERPEQPPTMPAALWQLVTSAWVEDFRARPAIHDIAVALEGIP